jgi:hypothetical protein
MNATNNNPSISLDVRIANNFRLPACVGDGSITGRPHLIREFSNCSALVWIWRSFPRFTPTFEFGRLDFEIERACLGVHHNDDTPLRDRFDRSLNS